MELSKFINLSKGDIVSIVGAGGKTSLMFTLAEELRRDYKLLVTTTTKIFLPEKNQYDYMAIDLSNIREIRYSNNKGVYIYGSFINEDEKLVGISTELLDLECSFFDYVFVEADGSKGKPIKGWNKTEPVISRKTKKTIGVLSIESIGKNISDENVHRVDEFLNITNADKNEAISIENMLSVIFHTDGIFKNSAGERILFINKVEDNEQIILAEELVNSIKIKNEKYMLIDKIIYGSLKKKVYKRV